jgi:hypothetical protein
VAPQARIDTLFFHQRMIQALELRMRLPAYSDANAMPHCAW